MISKLVDLATRKPDIKNIPVSIGTDTEFFLLRKDNNNPVFGPGLEEAVNELNLITPAWHVDGCSAEFVVKPGRTPEELIDNIQPILESVNRSNYTISSNIVVDIPSWLKEDMYQRFGQLLGEGMINIWKRY